MQTAMTNSLKLVEPIGAPGKTAGTAVVSVLVAGSADDVWTALTERDPVSLWFGDLSASLKPGARIRLDFGDGDFFDIDNIHCDPPHRLTYCWRFLGTSPLNEICWSIEPAAHGCLVTVADAEAGRGPAGVAEMIEGWTDFLQRLQDFRATGMNARYAWRSEFSGSIELRLPPADAYTRLFSAEAQARWLPWSGSAIAPGASVVMTDGQQPDCLSIGTVETVGPQAVRFTVTAVGWSGVTRCQVSVQPWRGGALLVLLHDGWNAIAPDDAVRNTQRKRFGKSWLQSLERAREIADV